MIMARLAPLFPLHPEERRSRISKGEGGRNTLPPSFVTRPQGIAPQDEENY